MKLRVLSIIAAVLAAVAVGAWMWFGKDGADPAVLDAPEDSASTATPPAPRKVDVSAPASPAVPMTPGAGPLSPATPAIKLEPAVRVTSSVVPGMPMVRGAYTPPRPPGAALPAGGPGPVSRVERQVEGQAELGKVQMMLRDFRTRMGENPVGSNAEIMRAVMGGNPAGARLGPPEGQEINEQGELVDQWGTPYFFHQLSKTSMEVRSAGPDRKMWTTDDLVTK